MTDKVAVVGSNLEEAHKSVERARELSLQARARPDSVAFGGSGLLLYLVQAGELVSPWWSSQRDADLDAFWKRSDHLSGAMAMLVSKVVTVPVRAMPRDTSVKAHLAQAEECTVRLVEEAEFGESLVQCLSKWLQDFWACDNGAFFEIIGGGAGKYGKAARHMSDQERRDKGVVAGPIVGSAEGLAHLDSHRCIRTGNSEYPVVYRDTDGSLFRYHCTRVAFAADLPSARAEMNGVGFCAVSRVINNAQHLIDLGIYKQEKLGSRPKRAVIVGKRVSTEVVTGAFQDADELMDSQGLRRFSKVPIIGDLDADADLSFLDLASLPDGFNEEISTNQGMFAMALAFGVPIRWLWPAAVTGATKADAMYQHIAGLGGGVGRVLQTLTVLLGGDPRGAYHATGRFLPPQLKLVFDFQDDEQDRNRAEIREVRARTRTADLGAGILTVRAAREQALEDGDLTRAQFEQMELDEGRLPDGSDVLSLFASDDDATQRLLDLGVKNPLDLAINTAPDMLKRIIAISASAQAALVTARTAAEKARARQVLAALDALKELYSGAAAPVEETRRSSSGEGTKQDASRDASGDELSDAVDTEESAHKALRVVSPCPLPGCGGLEADLYPGHKGVLVCRKCHRTYDPEAWTGCRT